MLVLLCVLTSIFNSIHYFSELQYSYLVFCQVAVASLFTDHQLLETALYAC